MPAVSFHTMKDQILDGRKKQTIRPKSDEWLKWKEGDWLSGWWYQRSPDEEKRERLFESEFSEAPYVITPDEWTEKLARKDGFDDLEGMRSWFKDTHGEDYRDKKFVVIRWR